MSSDRVNDSTTFFYYVRDSTFYVKVKASNKHISPYVAYYISATRRTKVTSFGRKDEQVPKTRYINVNLLRVKKSSATSQFIEDILKESR